MRVLTAIPVYNEERHLHDVLREAVPQYAQNILIIDDGSSDGTSQAVGGRKESARHHPSARTAATEQP